MPIKIIDLASEDAPSDDDLILIRDNATQTTRKITRARFFENPPLPAKSITAAMLADGAVSKRSLGEDAKIGVRTFVVASPSTLTPDVANYDVFAITNLNTTLTIANHVGTPLDGQGMLIRIKDNGTARAVYFGSKYRMIGISNPGQTIANMMLYYSMRWNDPAQMWDILSVGRQ